MNTAPDLLAWLAHHVLYSSQLPLQDSQDIFCQNDAENGFAPQNAVMNATCREHGFVLAEDRARGRKALDVYGDV